MKEEARQGEVVMDMNFLISVFCKWDFEGNYKALKTVNISSSFSTFASINRKCVDASSLLRQHVSKLARSFPAVRLHLLCYSEERKKRFKKKAAGMIVVKEKY